MPQIDIVRVWHGDLQKCAFATGTQWGSATQHYSSSSFDMIGGMVGFALSNGIGSVDDFTLKSWDGSGFNVIEHSDSFTIDGNGRSANDPAYDLAGNMTFDGTQKLRAQPVIPASEGDSDDAATCN